MSDLKWTHSYLLHLRGRGMKTHSLGTTCVREEQRLQDPCLVYVEFSHEVRNFLTHFVCSPCCDNPCWCTSSFHLTGWHIKCDLKSSEELGVNPSTWRQRHREILPQETNKQTKKWKQPKQTKTSEGWSSLRRKTDMLEVGRHVVL